MRSLIYAALYNQTGENHFRRDNAIGYKLAQQEMDEEVKELEQRKYPKKEEKQ